MQIALKFTIAITAGVALVLVLQAWLHVARIADLQEREIRDDLAILGRVLSTASAELWAHAGKERAEAFLEGADDRREQTSIRLVRPGALPARLTKMTFERRSQMDHWHVVAMVPVRVAERTVALIEIDRRLPHERSYFRSILWTQVGTTLVAALLCGVISLTLGVWLIGRPLRQLSDLAHRVADGDLGLKSQVSQRDEIGRLADELNAMTDRLAETDAKVREERRARTKALEQLRHADRLSTVGKLASSIAHELGTPLNVVSGRAAMIASPEATHDETRENASIIVVQAQRMAAIIRDLLDFSRRKQLDRASCRIGDVLDHAVTLMEPVCEDKGVSTEVEGARDVAAEIDSGKILQVLTNLMMNAIHAMPNGGRLTLTAGHRCVEDPADRHVSGGDFICLQIRDEGVGIPPEQLPDIFDAFFTTKKEGRGTGLGLSVCHGIVREHGGFIEVESEVGGGTCFSVYLPGTGAA